MGHFAIKTLHLMIALIVLTLPYSAAHADSILNQIFPSIFGPPEKGPKPEQTLIAPFAQNPQGATRILSESERKLLTSPENSIPISEPHRSNKYISIWAAEKTAGLLILDPEKLSDQIKKMDEIFTPAGKQEFMSYLTSNGFLESVQTQHQKIRSFVTSEPQILNEGNFGGTYRWLIDVPLTLSVMPAQMNNYAGKNISGKPLTQNIIIRIQVGRTQTGYVDGVAIERWTLPGAS